MNSKWVQLTNAEGWTGFLLRSPRRISIVSFCSHNPVLLFLLVRLLLRLWVWMGSGEMKWEDELSRRAGPAFDDSERDERASGGPLMSLIFAPWRKLVAQVVWPLHANPRWKEKKKTQLTIIQILSSKQTSQQTENKSTLCALIESLYW